jgi:hypothetical protein
VMNRCGLQYFVIVVLLFYMLSWLSMHSVVFVYVFCKLCVKGVLDDFMVGV